MMKIYSLQLGNGMAMSSEKDFRSIGEMHLE